MGAASRILLPLATNATEDTSWVAPLLLLAGGAIVALINGAAAIWRRRQDKRLSTEDKLADKQSTEKDAWDEVRTAREEATHYYNLYRLFETMFYTVRNALRELANLVHRNHPEHIMDKTTIEALELKPPDDLSQV